MSFDAASWEDRYRHGPGASKHQPSPSLVAAVSALPTGRALDAGCGVGADARWLAGRGWQVTAVDVSPTALDHGRGAAPAAPITWVHADLTTWEPDRPFDLVCSHYVHVPGPPEVLVQRLASWVAPGGRLLVVGHAGGHGHPDGAHLRTEDVAALPADQWEVLIAEPRTHLLDRPDGGGQVALHDVVLHARRRS